MSVHLPKKVEDDHDVLNNVVTQMLKTYKLCDECYAQARYPGVLKPTDFKQVDFETVLGVDHLTNDDNKELQHTHLWSLNGNLQLVT